MSAQLGPSQFLIIIPLIMIFLLLVQLSFICIPFFDLLSIFMKISLWEFIFVACTYKVTAVCNNRNHLIRAAKKFLSSRLIMNSTWLWNSHQRYKFLRARASGDILNLESWNCHF